MKVYIGNYPKNPAKERKVDVRIDPWDTWSVDHTLAVIIAPLLKQLKATQHGHPCGIDTDEKVNVTNDKPCGDCKCEVQWNEILDKMIFAFDALVNDDWEDQFHSGEMDIVWTPVNANGEPTPDGEYRQMDKGPNDTHVFDVEGWKAYNERIQEGLELFGKHFRSLWD